MTTRKGTKTPLKSASTKAAARLAELFLGALSDVGGQEYLARIAEEYPKDFLSLLARVLPLQADAETAGETLKITWQK